MFSGIVEEVGVVRALRRGHLTIACHKVLEGTREGDSINVNGACLTVTNLSADAFSVDLMPETLRRTNLGQLKVGDGVNLERALGVGDRLGGHFVQGHVEGTGRILSFTPEGEAVLARFSLPPELARYVVPKGFIAVDGISLTVVDCDGASFSVSLVAYTMENTTIVRKKVGDAVNLETDIIAKYVEAHLAGRGQGGISREFLEEHGFGSS